MQRAAALRRIDRMRFDVRPKSNQLTAIGNSTHGFAEVHSRGVEAALAASTHAGRKEAEEERSHKYRSQSRVRNLGKVSILGSDSGDQLNFELVRNKDSMAVFMIRLRRVYRA